MPERIQEEFTSSSEDWSRSRLLKMVEKLYHRLVLIVGPPDSGKTAILQKFASDAQGDVISISAELSEHILNLTAKQRPLHVPKILEQRTAAIGGTVLLDNVEILFDVELRQDPLRLLQQISRNRTVVAAWNGYIDGGKLMYAKSGHPEFRVYEAKDLIIVETTDEHRCTRID